MSPNSARFMLMFFITFLNCMRKRNLTYFTKHLKAIKKFLNNKFYRLNNKISMSAFLAHFSLDDVMFSSLKLFVNRAKT